MNDDERRQDSLSDTEQVLEQRLIELGAVLREQEAAPADLDPVFVRDLRAHLVHGEELAPHPGFVRRLRRQLIDSTDRTGQPWRNRLGLWLAAAAVVLALILSSLVPLAHRAAFTIPHPTRADLLFALPAPPVTVRHLTPTESLIHPASATPYEGHLQLSRPALPQAPLTVRGYRLAPVAAVAARGRVLLAIRSPVHTETIGLNTWEIAADHVPHFPHRLHSLAVNVTTGEVIYHDQRNYVLPHSAHPLARATAISVARHWLSRLGWPGARMPVRSAGIAPGRPKVVQLIFGWAGLGPAFPEEATLQVAPDRSVIEAWIWPPVASSGPVRLKSVLAAWEQLTVGTAPVVIPGISPHLAAPGKGALRHVRLASILVPDHQGHTFLVPVYQFAGKMRLRGRRGDHAWISLVPGI